MRNVAAWKTICLNTFSVLFPSFVLLLPKREDEIQTLTLFSAVFVPNVAADSVSLRIVPILPIHMCTLLPQCSSTCEWICQLLILQHHICGQDRVSLTVDRGTARKTYSPQGKQRWRRMGAPTKGLIWFELYKDRCIAPLTYPAAAPKGC